MQPKLDLLNEELIERVLDEAFQLLMKPGLYRAGAVLDVISLEFAYFSAAMQGVPEVGVDLKVNQLAEPATSAAATA